MAALIASAALAGPSTAPGATTIICTASGPRVVTLDAGGGLAQDVQQHSGALPHCCFAGCAMLGGAALPGATAPQTVTATATVTLPPGNYTVRAVFTSANPNYGSSQGTYALRIESENALPAAEVSAYTGQTAATAEERYRQEGIALFRGVASFEDDHHVRVNGQVLRADRFLLATGSRPEVPKIDGLAEAGPITSVEAVSLRRLPASLIILGGGPVVLEAHPGDRRAGLVERVGERRVEAALGDGTHRDPAHDAVREHRDPERRGAPPG